MSDTSTLCIIMKKMSTSGACCKDDGFLISFF